MLRYPGGKTRAIKKFDALLPSEFSELVSPFFGGGSFELFVKEKYQIPVYANDKFEPLINFWKVLQSNPVGLHDLVLSRMPLSKEKFHEYRNDLNDPDREDLERAACYFMVNRASFSGSTCSGGYSKESAEKRLTISSVKKMLNIDLSSIEFSNEDFVTFLERSEDGVFLFLDPPYYLGTNSKLYGKKGDLHENFDHEKLAEILKTRTNWMLCYNDCPFIRETYKDYKIQELEWAYGMNESKKSSEIVVTNYTA